MKKNDFNELLASVKEAGSIKKVRRSLNVTQEVFSRMIGVSVGTLQNWEQGRREPEGPARALLTVAAKNPQAVLSALHE